MTDGQMTRRRFLRATGGVVGGSALLYGSSRPIRAQSNETWPQFGYDAANTGYAPDNTGPLNEGTDDFGTEAEWIFETSESIRSSPVVADGTVYFGSGDGSVYAVDADDGTQQWAFPTGSNPSSPAVVDETVYFGSGDGSVYAVDTDDGEQRWTFEVENIWNAASPTVADGTVYVGSEGREDNLYALDASDGTERWNFTDEDLDSERITSPPAVVNNTVYFGGERGPLYAVNATDGTEQWTYPTEGVSNMRSPPSVVNDTVYVGRNSNGNGKLSALDAATGTELWTFETDNPLGSALAVADGTVYVGSEYETVSSDRGELFAVDAANGTEQWNFRTDWLDDAQLESSPAIVDGTVYFGGSDGYFYALDAADGTEVDSFEIGGSEMDAVRSSPAVVDGTVYFGSDNGNLYAVSKYNNPLIQFVSNIGVPQEAISALFLTALGAGAWWYSRQGESSGETDEPSDGLGPLVLDSEDGTDETGQLRGEIDSIQSNLDDVDSFVNEGEYEDARGRLVSLKPRLESAKETALEDDADDAFDELTNLEDRLDDRLKEVGKEIGQTAQQDDTQRSAHRVQLRERIDSLHATLDQVESLVENGDLDRARERLTDLEGDITSAKNVATDEGFDDLHEEITTLEQRRQDRLTEITERIERRDDLSDEIASLRGKLGYVTRLINSDDFETAHETLAELESRFEPMKTRADKMNFDELRTEVATLEQRYQEHLEEVSQRLETYPIPEEIPRAPNISVEYDALINREPIGGGGSADVTKATLPTPDGDVTLAVKEPRLSGTLHADQAERILREAETWEKLDDHDHIVGIIDYGSDPLPWIAMEYMDGGDLGERGGEMDAPQALWTALAVTKGVRHAHRRGVAHLDLKPENVLFRTVEDRWCVPKVADWGLSKQLLEHSKSVEGISVEYAAPEQFDDGYGPTDDITDIYQLGAVFYELFTGRPPFEGQPFEVIEMVKNDRPTPPSAIADVPDGLDEVLLTALAKEKGDRYDDIVYLRDDLRELFDER